MTLKGSDLVPAEYDRIVWSASPEEGVTVEEMLKPEFWAHVAAKFRPGAKIEVRPVDGAYYSELIVKSCGPTWAQVVPLFTIALDVASSTSDDNKFEVAFKGPKNKWSVIRKADNQYMKVGLGSRDDANRWITDYRKALAA